MKRVHHTEWTGPVSWNDRYYPSYADWLTEWCEEELWGEAHFQGKSDNEINVIEDAITAMDYGAVPPGLVPDVQGAEATPLDISFSPYDIDDWLVERIEVLEMGVERGIEDFPGSGEIYKFFREWNAKYGKTGWTEYSDLPVIVQFYPEGA